MSSSGYDLVRVTFHGVTHAARQYTSGVVTTACGVAGGLGETHRVSIMTAGMPDVDCMACLVAEGMSRAR